MDRASVVVCVRAFSALSMVCAAPTLEAQASRVAQQNVCSFYALPLSASTRALAMGDANTVGRDDDVIFYNPARLAIARGSSVAGERHDVGVASGTLSSVARFANGGIGIGAHVTAGRDPYCPNTSTEPPRPDTPTFLALGTVGFAQTVKRFQFGAATKFVAEQRGSRSSRLVADVGVARDMSIGIVPISIGVAGQNLSNDMSSSLMPWRVALGASAGAPIGPFDLALAAQAATTRHDQLLAGGGIEIGYQWLDGYSFALRSGLRRFGPDNVDGYTGGAGLVLDRLTIDYAFETHPGDRPVGHRLGLRIR